MKSNTIIIVVVIVVLLVIFMMYQSSQAQKSTNEQMLWMMQNQQNQTPANVWSSTDNWSGIIDAFRGIFGNNNDDEYFDSLPPDVARTINTRAYGGATPFAATQGFDNLRDMVEFGEGSLMNS